MRTAFFVVALALAGSDAFAQVPGAPVLVVGNTDVGTLVNRLKVYGEDVQLVESALAELQDADAMVRNQLQALQELKGGSWDSLAQALDSETEAIDGYAAALSGLPSLDEIASVRSLVATEGYAEASAGAQALLGSFQAADAVAHGTDALVEDTASRQAIQGSIDAQAGTQGGVVAQLQAENESLGLLGEETREVGLTVDSAKRYLLAEQESAGLRAELDHARAEEFMTDTSGQAYASRYGDWNELDDSLR